MHTFRIFSKVHEGNIADDWEQVKCPEDLLDQIEDHLPDTSWEDLKDDVCEYNFGIYHYDLSASYNATHCDNIRFEVHRRHKNLVKISGNFLDLKRFQLLSKIRNVINRILFNNNSPHL